MNFRKYFALFCAAVSLLVCSACGSEDTEDVEMEASSVSDGVIEDEEEDESEVDTASTTTKTNRVTTTNTEKTTTTKASTTTTTKSGSSDGMRSYSSTAATKSNSSSNSSSSGNSSANSSDSSSNSSSSGNSANNSSNSNSSSDSNSSSNASANSSSSSDSSSDSSSSKSTTTKATTAAKTTTTTTTTTTTAAVTEETNITISLSDSGCSSSSSSGVSISGSVITLTQEGRYEFVGTLSNGQIVVTASKEEKVDIYLNGVSISCSTSAPINVTSADTCTIHLVAGSTNYIADTASNEKTAAIFSKDDLTIKGSGTLTVVGNAKHAIKSNNDVKVKNGTLYLSAVAAGIYGEDSIQVSGGTIYITSCKDGLKACDDTEVDGYVTVEDGYIDVQNASGNGIQADVSITISGGTVKVHSTKKGLNCDNAQYDPSCYSEY